MSEIIQLLVGMFMSKIIQLLVGMFGVHRTSAMSFLESLLAQGASTLAAASELLPPMRLSDTHNLRLSSGSASCVQCTQIYVSRGSLRNANIRHRKIKSVQHGKNILHAHSPPALSLPMVCT